MYVEDNPANISLMQRIARMGGHEVINYTNGDHVLDNFEKDQPNLVLMDLQLEGRMTGLEIVRTLRERGFRTPIVAVTAYAMVGDRERCIEAGCDSYLSKPLPVAELVELVKDYALRSQQPAVEAAQQEPQQQQPTVEAAQQDPQQPAVEAAQQDPQQQPATP